MVWIMTSIGEGYERDLTILSVSVSYLPYDPEISNVLQ